MGSKRKLETATAGKSGLHKVIKALEWVRNSELKSTQKLVLYALASRIDKKGGCFPQRKRIAEDTGLGLSTISKVLGELENGSYITVRRKKHQKTGNLYFDKIVLNFPGPSPAKGTSLNLLGSVTPGPQVSDVEPITKHNKDNNTLEVKLEDKKSIADLKVVYISDLEKTSDKNNKDESEIQSEKADIENNVTVASAQLYVMTTYDWSAVNAMVWWELFYPDVKDREICKVNAGGEVELLNENEILRLQANELVSNYTKGCEKSPKARISFWFEMRRHFFPSLPGSSHKKKLSPLASKTFHEEIFGALGPKACYVIAYMMDRWPMYQSSHIGKYPNIEDMANYVEHWEEGWLTNAFRGVTHNDKERLVGLINRLAPELMS